MPNVSDVGEANALWIAKERAAGFDARTEAAALCRLMEGSSRARYYWSRFTSKDRYHLYVFYTFGVEFKSE